MWGGGNIPKTSLLLKKDMIAQYPEDDVLQTFYVLKGDKITESLQQVMLQRTPTALKIGKITEKLQMLFFLGLPMFWK